MGWEKIDYACGHTGREQIYGKTSERSRKAEWIGNNKVCKDCWIKGRADTDRKAALLRAGITAPVPENKIIGEVANG